MKLISVCAFAVLLSSGAFAQAKPSDLAATPMNRPVSTETTKADTSIKASPRHKVSKSHRTAGKVKKFSKKAASNGKKRIHTASAKTHRVDNKSVAR
jgi:hypothetical protein